MVINLQFPAFVPFRINLSPTSLQTQVQCWLYGICVTLTLHWVHSVQWALTLRYLGHAMLSTGSDLNQRHTFLRPFRASSHHSSNCSSSPQASFIKTTKAANAFYWSPLLRSPWRSTRWMIERESISVVKGELENVCQIFLAKVNNN